MKYVIEVVIWKWGGPMKSSEVVLLDTAISGKALGKAVGEVMGEMIGVVADEEENNGKA